MIRRTYPYYEWGLLAVAAPFLLFPTVWVEGTFAALFALALFWAISAFARRPWPETPFNAALLLFAVAVAVGTLVTAWPELTLSKATGLVLGLGLFRAMAGLREDRGLRWGWLVLAGAGIAIAVVGTLSTQFYVKIPVVAPLIERLPARLLTLPEGPEGGVSANQFAGVLAFYLPLALGWLGLALDRVLRSRTIRDSGMPFVERVVRYSPRLLLAGASVVVTSVLLVVTQSRSGWIGGVAGVLALVAMRLWASRRRSLRAVLLGLAAFIVIGTGALVVRVPAEAWDRAWGDDVVAETEITGRVSFSGRVEIWSRALYAIQDFPFTGCGLGTLRKVVPVLYPLFTVSPNRDIAHAHNIFLQTATDVGLPGLIAYLALLGVAAVVAWQGEGYRGLPLLAALVALHIYGLTDAIALGSKPGVVWWVALGLIAAIANVEPQEPVRVRHD